MAEIEARLAALGWQLPPAPTAPAAYVPAVRVGRYIHTSGQLPLVEGALRLVGQLGRDLDVLAAQPLARACTLHALAAIRHLVGDLDLVDRVVKLTGYVASAPSFTEQPGVINAASELLLDVFGDRGRHARTAVGVAALPFGAPVEVELIVALTD